MIRTEILEKGVHSVTGLTTDNLITRMLDLRCPYFSESVVYPPVEAKAELSESKNFLTRSQPDYPLIDFALQSKSMSQHEATVSNCSFIYQYLSFSELFILTHYLIMGKSICFVSNSIQKLSSAM